MPPHETRKKAITVVEDETATFSDRVDALEFLGRDNATEYIDRLGILLQGNYDALAFHILYTFKTFGHPRACAHIVHYEETIRRKKLHIPGKINTALASAKIACCSSTPPQR